MLEFDPHAVDVILTVLAGSFMFAIQFAGLIWRISKAEGRIHEKINSVEHNGSLDIQAVRQEILETKLFITNEFVKKDTLKTILNELDARLIRLEGKLDSLMAHAFK